MKFRVWDKEKKTFCKKRKFKFRGYSPNEKRMYDFGELSQFMTHDYGFSLDLTGDECFPNDLILNQSSCVPDINGKEIYDGDIVRITDKNIHVLLGGAPEYTQGEVVVRDGTYYICQNGFGRTNLSDYVHCDCCNQAIEIIGNIYENPEIVSIKGLVERQ